VYYRGARLLRAIMASLLANATVGLSSATDVVVSGCSAGGLSTFLHADEWAARLPAAKVAAMPDSGFFLEVSGGREVEREVVFACAGAPCRDAHTAAARHHSLARSRARVRAVAPTIAATPSLWPPQFNYSATRSYEKDMVRATSRTLLRTARGSL